MSCLFFLNTRLNKQQVKANTRPPVERISIVITPAIEYVTMLSMGNPSGGMPSKCERIKIVASDSACSTDRGKYENH